jgi:hypothetical protein
MDRRKLIQLNPWDNNEAIVTKTIEPYRDGRIRLHSTEWPARCLQNQRIPINTRVQVIGYHKATWYVEVKASELETMTAYSRFER